MINESFGADRPERLRRQLRVGVSSQTGRPGQGLFRIRVAVLSDDGQPSSPPWEIALDRYHPNTMLEYWPNAEATKQKFHDDWLLTGDLGQIDEDAYLWLLSRKHDVTNSAGYCIGPGEIEACLGSHLSPRRR